MHILIVAEKPSIARAIAPFARKHWPAAHLTFVNANPYGNFKFAYPRGLKWADYPTLSEPQHKLRDWSDWRCPPVELATNGALAPLAMSPDLLTRADLIVNACDPDHTGAVSFDILLNQVFGDDRAKDCPSLCLFAIDDASIEKSFSKMHAFGETFASLTAYGHAKRYFDWNWNVNAQALLGEAARRAGVAADAPPVSKYALQLLYALQHSAPVTDGTVAVMMDKWSGTGRYSYAMGAWRPRLGSCASRWTIIENLLAAGLLARQDTLLTLSPVGHAFLALVHPDCRDFDLPFRLHAWCEQGLGTAQPAMDRYLKTFFGKQKRYLGGRGQ